MVQLERLFSERAGRACIVALESRLTPHPERPRGQRRACQRIACRNIHWRARQQRVEWLIPRWCRFDPRCWCFSDASPRGTNENGVAHLMPRATSASTADGHVTLLPIMTVAGIAAVSSIADADSRSRLILRSSSLRNPSKRVPS